MSNRKSEDSIVPSIGSATGFITPEGSLNRVQPSGETNEQTVPAYSENPYIANQPATNPYTTSAPRRSQSTRRTSFGSATTERRGITGSIRSMFRRNSHTSSRTHGENGEENEEDGEHKGEDEEEKKEETPEEVEKRMEDPQHLLNTILEEPEEGIEEPMVPVQEAIVTVDGNSAYESPREVYQRRQGYRENLMRHRKLRRYTKTSRTVSKMRDIYQKIMTWALVTRVFVYWLPLAVILFIPLAVGAWRNPNMQLGGTRVMWIFIWLEVVWGSLWVGKLFAHYMPEVVGFIMSIFLPKYFRYVDMFLRLELAVQLVIWTFISFISFSPLLTVNGNALQRDHQPKWQEVVQNICVALLVSAIVFFVEQVFMYLLSTSFHRTRMSLRIENHKKSINVLIILLDLAYKFFPYQCDEFEEEDESLRYATLKRASKKVSGIKSKNKVLDKMKNTVNNVARNVGNIVADATASQNSRPSVAKIVKTSLTNHETREILASRIWKSLVMEDSNALMYDDLLNVFGADRKEEVLYMFDILDSDGQDGIDLDEMIDSVNRIGRESKQISKSLVDMDGAITKLHYLLMCLALVLIVIIFVGMLAPSSATVLATLGSTLLSMSFLFSATAQEVFQSCVFLFVKHPFDAGDWIQTTVPSVGLVRMQVVELNLMYSVFTQIGVNTRRQVSNSVLNAQFIDNISRSPPSQISVVLTIGIPETTKEQLDEFEIRLNEFVDSNPREYAPGVFFQAVDQTDLDRLSLNICINTRNNQSDIVLFSSRRTKALEFIGQCIHDIPIAIPHREDQSFHDPSLPVFHYDVKDIDEAMTYVEKAKGKRRTLGMLPPTPEEDESVGGDGYVDSSVNNENAASAIDSQAYIGGTTRVKRQMSTSSRQSRVSRAFSTASRSSQTFGLRSRGQLPGDGNIARNEDNS